MGGQGEASDGLYSLAKKTTVSVAGLLAVCYAAGYMVSQGYALKLGLPVNMSDHESLLVEGARFIPGTVWTWLNTLPGLGWPAWIVGGITVLAILFSFRTCSACTQALLTLVLGILAVVFTVNSLYTSWQPVKTQRLLFEQPAYIADYIVKQSRREVQEVDLERASALLDRETDPDRIDVRKEQIVRYESRLQDTLDSLDRHEALLPENRLVYCSYFESSDTGCAGELERHYSLISMSLVLAFALTWFTTVNAPRFRGLILGLMSPFLVFSLSLVLLDYGWLISRAEFQQVSYGSAGGQLLYVGRYGDRYAFLSLEPPRLVMPRSAAIPELILGEWVNVFAEVVRRARNENP